LDYGTTQGASKNGGLVAEAQYSKLVIDFDYGDLGSTADTIMSEVVIPIGAHFVSADIFVTSVFAGASGTLEVGLVQADDRATEIDFDGFFSATATTTLTLDQLGDSPASDGALLTGAANVPMTVAGLVTIANGGGDMTAGAATLTLEYFHAS
jgi:hypothetical protein